MKKIIILISIISLLLIVGCSPEEEHTPSGDECEIDSDCICTLKCADCCGKPGQSWKCVDNKCQLGFYNE